MRDATCRLATRDSRNGLRESWGPGQNSADPIEGRGSDDVSQAAPERHGLFNSTDEQLIGE
jgi:hypothetical protein